MLDSQLYREMQGEALRHARIWAEACIVDIREGVAARARESGAKAFRWTTRSEYYRLKMEGSEMIEAIYDMQENLQGRTFHLHD